MKKFILQEILLLSTTERRAKKVSFDPKRTIVFGKNETGKSSLLKSIYSTFGAAPAKQNSKWKGLDPISFVKFEVDGISYAILKDGKYYAVFDSTNKLISVFDSITNSLGPFLAKLFDFKLKLTSQSGDLITPPPAFLFLPFYIDQDVSWNESWQSFSNLSQVKKYKKPVIEYHTGLRANEYYEAKGEITQIEEQINVLENERKISQSILKKIKDKLADVDFTIDLDDFREEVKELLVECESLRTERDKIKSKIVDLFNFKVTLESQITITKQALNEARRDFNFAALDIEDEIDCPTCGTHFQNSFVERFEIALDENRCKDLLVNLTRELNDVNGELEKQNEVLGRRSEELLKVEALLESKKGDIHLRDLIENEGRKELKHVFQDSLDELNAKIIENARLQKDLTDKIKALENKGRKEEIRIYYRTLMKKYLYELGLMVNENDYKDLTQNLKNTGSALPRTLIAYYFSILQVIQKNSHCAFCPIIIDSPNQQGQDLENIEKILLFIKNNQPQDSQLILGLENNFNIDFECKVVEVHNKHRLLNEEEYETVHQELGHYLNQMWLSGKTNKLFRG